MSEASISNSQAWIFANGEDVNLHALRGRIDRQRDFVIAADGGLRFVRAMEMFPHLLVGDFDSLPSAMIAEARAAGSSIRQFPPEKNETDLELALLAAIEQGARKITIVGALGGRLDMTLGNIFLLQLPQLAGMDVRLDDGNVEVCLIHHGETRLIEGLVGETVSLLPLGGAVHGIRTEGLAYSLRDESLFPERTRGISNTLAAPQAAVSIRSGVLICIRMIDNR